MQTLRFADEETVQHYPLHIPGGIVWSRITDGWQTSIELPDLPKDTIVTPSLSVLNQPDYRYQFTLEIGTHEYPLAVVPSPDSGDRVSNPSDHRLRTAIDCFHTGKTATGVRLVVSCFTEQEPERYLLTLSVRATELAIEVSDTRDARTVVPPAHSQMLENPRIAGGICSPVSTAMALRLHRPCVDYHSVIRACFDPQTRMYGMWPLAIRAASQYGIVGAVELLSSWEPVIACLERGLPVVASIRFAAGELPGAPMSATGGHLVVVHGICGDQVLVNDPAAPNHGTVSRRYSVSAFSRAWFRYRGAAYILAP